MFAVLLADAFRGKDCGAAFGVWGAVTGLAVAIGPLIGGVLTSGLSWRRIFFVKVLIGIAAVALTTMRVAESRSPRATGTAVRHAGFMQSRSPSCQAVTGRRRGGYG